jgi:hypothetical protein
MIFHINTRGHGYALRSLVEGKLGCPAPDFRVATYDRLFKTGELRIPIATYIFGDLERLAAWELRIAAQLYRSMTAAGLRCLNDPARAMSRVELLTALHDSGINPFGVARADSNPRPSRFPVFLRVECNHQPPSSDLYRNQAELDQGLNNLRRRGMPLRGLLVVEHAAEPYSDGLWAKWGTWRIGERMIVEHLLLEHNWLVKEGHYLKLTDAAVQDEHDAVATNRFGSDLQRAFEIGGIEFGRADHARFAGQTIVYEINTNPFLSRFEADPRPLRKSTQLLARKRIAEALEAIDTVEGGSVVVAGPKSISRP